VLPFLEQANLVNGANYHLKENWWRTIGEVSPNVGVTIPNGTSVQMQLAVFQCPITPFPDRVQKKKETPPEQDKVGACGDYFVPEGVSLTINNDLAPSERFPVEADRRGALRPFPETTSFMDITDGTSNTILVGECAGREDVWRGRNWIPAAADKALSECARARGGAWATNDNPYEIGQRDPWCVSLAVTGPIPGPMTINNSNEWGHLYYSFHDGGACFALADGSVRFIPESISLRTLADLTTRAGGEVPRDY
jgi:hypothetical protein